MKIIQSWIIPWTKHNGIHTLLDNFKDKTLCWMIKRTLSFRKTLYLHFILPDKQKLDRIVILILYLIWYCNCNLRRPSLVSTAPYPLAFYPPSVVSVPRKEKTVNYIRVKNNKWNQKIYLCKYASFLPSK